MSVTIPLFGALAGGLFVVSGLMLALYLPAATHLKRLRMDTAGEPSGWDWMGCGMGWDVGEGDGWMDGLWEERERERDSRGPQERRKRKTTKTTTPQQHDSKQRPQTPKLTHTTKHTQHQ